MKIKTGDYLKYKYSGKDFVILKVIFIDRKFDLFPYKCRLLYDCGCRFKDYGDVDNWRFETNKNLSILTRKKALEEIMVEKL